MIYEDPKNRLYGALEVTEKLRADYVGKPPSYFQVYSRIRDGLIPASKIAGRLAIRESDIAGIAKLFGLTPAGSASPASSPHD